MIFIHFCQMQFHIFFQMKMILQTSKEHVKWCRYFFQSRNLIILSDGALYILLNWKWNYKNSIVLKSRSRILYFVRWSLRYSSVWKINLQSSRLTSKICIANWIYPKQFHPNITFHNNFPKSWKKTFKNIINTKLNT